jgi:two-component system phosphate regulon response regulator OmpR
MENTSHKILVVDDDPRLRDLLRRYLGEQGFTVLVAENATAMNKLWLRERFDLLVLDLMMPGEDGLSICRRLRGANDQTPIIMLTAKGEDVDRIVGLEMGADDYLPKPFNPRELVARVKAVLRRVQEPVDPDATIDVADVRVDPARREVRIAGSPVQLRGQEFELLLALARNEGRVMTREALLSQAWGYDYAGETRTVDVHVAWLRERLKGSAVEIQSVRGVGYKLVALS